MSFYEEALALQPTLVQWRRAFHQHAEGGYDLPHTLTLIRDVLNAHHVSFFEPCPSTLVADIGKGPAGMILRADMDALLMEEKSGLPFSSETDFAHTCGHDFHTAMLLGAACLLQAHADELPARTRLIFQPDEENITGARQLIAHNVVTPDFKGGFALHMSPTLDSGTLYYKDGPMYAASNEFIITVTGASTHGAAPSNGRDPIFAAVQIYNALQGLISRERPTLEPAVLSICAFNGGSTFNVIPDQAQLLGTLRVYNTNLAETIKTRLQEICDGMAKTLRCQVTLTFTTTVPPVCNDETLNHCLVQTLSNRAPELILQEQREPFAWSEDFALYGDILPISMMTLGAHVDGCSANIHNADVLFDETALAVGTAAHVCAAFSSSNIDKS